MSLPRSRLSRSSNAADRGEPSPSIAASTNPIDAYFRIAMIDLHAARFAG